MKEGGRRWEGRGWDGSEVEGRGRGRGGLGGFF